MPSSKATSLYHFFDYCLHNKLPVAVYHLPDTGQVKVVAQKQSHLLPVSKQKNVAALKGFLFAPFCDNKTHSGFIISPDVYTTATKLPSLNFAKLCYQTTATEYQLGKIIESKKSDYIGYVKDIQTEIKGGSFKKIVAARVIKKKKPEDFDAINYFENLCKRYPKAFTSLVYTPQYGLWIGATPEVLLTVGKAGFITYSLAGTRANTPENLKCDWGPKEKEEQKIVSEYITKAFKKVTKTNPDVLGPDTIVAGNLLHLRTTFTFKGVATNKWPEVVAQLHPTPAVAGLPKKESIAFINAHELTDRSFYSGYLGPVNLDNEVNLFVNLRCMQVLKNKLAVHAGCGITAASEPALEWKESKMKAQTLLGILRKDSKK